MIPVSLPRTVWIILGIVILTMVICVAALIAALPGSTAANQSQTSEAIPPMQGQFSTLTLATAFPDSPASVPVYRVDAIESIHEINGNRFSEKDSIPSAEEAPALAGESLKKYGGLPENALLVSVVPHYVQGYNLQTGENKKSAGENTQVRYIQVINTSPVIGAGIDLDLGENGEILSIFKDWITSYTTIGDTGIIPAQKAYAKLTTTGTVDRIQGTLPEGAKVTKIVFGYYLDCDVGSTLEPVWIFYTTFPDNPVAIPLMVDATDQ